MTDNHPITPPPELVQHWLGNHFGTTVSGEVSDVELAITTQAANWGADQELEGCVDIICDTVGHYSAQCLRAKRRPQLKPPTLNSIALQMLGTIERDARYLPEITDTIRKALEQLDD